jgi:outer membrane protein assembly factor BamB
LFIAQVSVDSNHVYVAQSDRLPADATDMNSLLATNGEIAWSQPFESQGNHYWAPLVVGGRVYFNGGEYGGLYAFDQGNGSEDWFAKLASLNDEWSPLFLDGNVYTFANGNLQMFDPASGALVASTPVAGGGGGDTDGLYSVGTSPVSDGTNIFIVSIPNVSSFSSAASTPLWTVAADYKGQAAVANGVLYALSLNGAASSVGGTLSALDASTGSALWTFAGDGTLSYQPVIAGHYVYVASDANVYAVDTTTHEQVWAGAPGGWLSIANGQLYVARADGTLDAWQLTQ